MGSSVSYPIVEMTQAGVWVAETMLARATKTKARVDLNSMMQGNKSQIGTVSESCLDGDIAQRIEGSKDCG